MQKARGQVSMMTLKGAIMQLVEMRENSMMPEMFKPYFDKVIETVSECVEPSAQPEQQSFITFDDITLYKCDPAKNISCKKSGCYVNGGPCKLTRHEEYREASINEA